MVRKGAPMLWIAKKVEAATLVKTVLLPSIVCMVIPTLIASRFKVFQGSIDMEEMEPEKTAYSGTMLYLGLGAIVFVPFFKTVTHLPPYVGMMLSLAVVALFAEIFSNRKFKMADATGHAQKKFSLIYHKVLLQKL